MIVSRGGGGVGAWGGVVVNDSDMMVKKTLREVSGGI